MRGKIDQYCIKHKLNLFFIDGADSCLIGIGQNPDNHYLIYDQEKYINLLINLIGNREEALDWFNNETTSTLCERCIFLEPL